MACYKPLKAYRSAEGKIVFDSKKGYADRPLSLKCGQCIGCRLDRTRGWAIRAVHEAQMHPKNSFITLTYNEKNLPNDGEEGQPPSGTLVVKHWQDFAKKLRKKMGPFRFLHCGEYGENGLRPHYHACIFGLDFAEDRKPWGKLFTSEELEGTWDKGFVTIGELTFDSAAYVAAYCLKKASGDNADARYLRVDPETGECWDVKPDYATMSLKPGLGKKWFEKYAGDVYPDDYVVLKGTKFRPPKYYDLLLEENDPDLLEKMKEKRRKMVRAKAQDITEERLDVRETVTWAKLKTYGNREFA